jgi:alpha-L-fucosidase
MTETRFRPLGRRTRVIQRRRVVASFLCLCTFVSATSTSPAAVITRAPSSGATTLPVESPAEHDQRMQWWRDARFGLFIHWGLYSIPAGEWRGVKTRGVGEWIMHDMQIPDADYSKLAEKFNPQHFDANRWVSIAKDAGMKYIVITTKHHEGFSLFDSKFTDYDVMSTPFKRDVMKELADATRAQGLKIGWYHSILDWHDPNAQKESTFPDYEWRLRSQVTELLTNYGDVGVMWFDGEWIEPWNDQRGEAMYKLCRSLQPDVIVNNRVGKKRAGMGGFTKSGGFAGDYATPEQQIPQTVPPGLDWETCMTINGTWGYKSDDATWKSAEVLLRNLIDIASKNGNFLLNVGPTADGDFPQEAIDRLHAMGRWLAVNGDAIYGTEGTPFPAKLPWGRATQRPGKVYLHVFDWPADQKLLVPLKTKPTKAYLMAARNQLLDIEESDGGILVQLPERAPDAVASVIVLDVEGKPEVVAPPPAALVTPSAATAPATRSTSAPANK